MTMDVGAQQALAGMSRAIGLGRSVALSASPSPANNQLLAALPPTEYGRLLASLESVRLPRGKIIQEAGSRLQHVYFPVSGVVSIMNMTEFGDTLEVAVVGNDGLVGIGVFMGGDLATSRAVVQSAGYGYRLAASSLRREFGQCGALHRLLLRYTHAFITHTGQAVGCTRYHAVDQRLCRCLLSSLDRLSGNELLITQEAIASTLGVRREAVTMAAKKLQAAGVIDYTRGHIAVLDRKNLEKRACGCYAAVKKAVARLMMVPCDSTRLARSGGPSHVTRTSAPPQIVRASGPSHMARASGPSL